MVIIRLPYQFDLGNITMIIELMNVLHEETFILD
jgi:hypothetical protein